MKMAKKHKDPMILNGTKVWLSAILFLITQTSAGIWWASSINTTVKMGFKEVAKQVDTLSAVVETNRKEVKQDIDELKRSKRWA